MEKHDQQKTWEGHKTSLSSSWPAGTEKQPFVGCRWFSHSWSSKLSFFYTTIKKWKLMFLVGKLLTQCICSEWRGDYVQMDLSIVGLSTSDGKRSWPVKCYIWDILYCRVRDWFTRSWKTWLDRSIPRQDNWIAEISSPNPCRSILNSSNMNWLKLGKASLH